MSKENMTKDNTPEAGTSAGPPVTIPGYRAFLRTIQYPAPAAGPKEGAADKPIKQEETDAIKQEEPDATGQGTTGQGAATPSSAADPSSAKGKERYGGHDLRDPNFTNFNSKEISQPGSQ